MRPAPRPRHCRTTPRRTCARPRSGSPSGSSCGRSCWHSAEISQAFAKPAGADQLQPQPGGFLLLSQKGVEEDFAQDLTSTEKAHLVAAQPKTSAAIFEAKPTTAAWRAKPSWYVVSSNDRMI